MGTTIRNVSRTMPKIDFSALKTADLRTVAPINEGMRPSAPASERAPEPAPEPAIQVQVSTPTPSVPVQSLSEPVFSVAKPPVSKPVGQAQKKISLMSLKTTGKSSAPASERAPEPAPQVQAPVFASPSASRPAISLESKPKTSETEVLPSVVEAVPVEPSSTESTAVPEAVSEIPEVPKFVEGVDIIAPAKVIGTEGETIANEILAEALEDPEEAKKRALEEAAQSVVIPESKKEFFPNLEMEDDFFKDPLFEGIVPQKEAAPAEAVIVSELPSEAVSETPSESLGPIMDGGAEPETEEIPPETVVTGQDGSPDGLIVLPESSNSNPSVDPAYVETIAKELSETRKGGLAKLFGERKILVRSLSWLVAVVALSIGTFAFVSPSIKTSAPESVPTDVPAAPIEIPLENGFPAVETPSETAVSPDENVPLTRIHSVRRPNRKAQAVHSSEDSALAQDFGSGASGLPSSEGTGTTEGASPSVPPSGTNP